MNNNYKLFIIKALVLPSLAIALIVSVFVSVPSYYLFEQVDVEEKKLGRLERQYRTLFSDVRFLMDQYALYQKYGSQFYDLEARGLVAGVKRLQWIDAILLFSYAYQFKNMSAVLLPEQPIKRARLGKHVVPSNIFYLNPIRFSALLPLDIDFMRFVSFVDDRISNFYFFKSCAFQDGRVGDLYNVKTNVAGMFSLGPKKEDGGAIKVNCVLNVVTSKLRKRGEK